MIAYNLQVATDAAFTTNVRNLVDANQLYSSQTSQTDATYGWTLGATYYYRVRARNSNGYGTWSSTISLIAPGLPATMAIPTFISRSYDQINIGWTPLSTDTETGRCTIIHYSLRARLST